MWRCARWIARGRGSARCACHLNLPRAAVPMAGGSGAEEGHCREEFHRRKDGVARVRRAGAVEAGSPPVLSSSSCGRPASLGSPVLTSTSPRSRAGRGLRRLGHRGTDVRGGDSHGTDDRACDDVSVVGVGRRAEVTTAISGLALSGRGGLEKAGRFQMRRVLMGPAVGAQVSAASFASFSPAAASRCGGC
ncbi:hypothetical protein VPH35_063306 [Triticum aestivum]|uniref:uncharacterized protein isoform X1 n=1 Tax=Triticum aestivum TaxID=4565 RepID=UPI001D00DF44|nr:uncharacterized protein LOC123080718 isoform X1 [Triticum aestivum]